MIYIFISLLIIFYIYKFDIRNQKSNRYLSYWFLFVLLVCLAGFRYYIGTDTYQYRQEYDSYPDIFNFSYSDFTKVRYQPLWMILVMVLRFFSNSFMLLQFVVAVILNLGVFKRVLQFSPKPFVSIFIYFTLFYLLSNFELIRESVAVGIFLLFGLNYLLKKQFLKFYLCAIVCYLFHPGSIVLLLLPFVPIKPIRPSKAIPFVVGFAIIVISFKAYFFEYLALLFGGNATIDGYGAGILNNYEDKKIGYYLNYYYPYFISIMLLLFFEKNKKVVPFTNYILLSIFFGVLSDLHYALLRFNNYLMLFSVVFYTYSVILISKKYQISKMKTIVYFSLIYSLPFIYLYAIKPSSWVEGSKAMNYSRWFPYRSEFQDLTDDQREMVRYYNSTYYDQMYK